MDQKELIAMLSEAAETPVSHADLAKNTKRIKVDMDTRKITGHTEFGVIRDHLAENVIFEVKRYKGETDLAEKNCAIHWENGENGGVLPVTEIDLSEEGYILMRWELSDEFTQYEGKIAYALHFFSILDGGFTYHAATNAAAGTLGNTLNASAHSKNKITPSEIEVYIARMNALSAEIDSKLSNFDAFSKQTQLNKNDIEKLAEQVGSQDNRIKEIEENGSGATEEQLEQIEQNKADITKLSADFVSVDERVRYLEEHGTIGGGGSNGSVKLENKSGFTTKNVAAGNDVVIAFNFTSTVDGEATGDGSCKITVNSVTKTTQNVKQGYNEINVTDYLAAGTNTLIVRVTDIYGNYKLLNFTITMVDLRIAQTFDDTLTYNNTIQYKYTPYGAIEKTVHVLLDGTEIHTNTIKTSGRQITVNIPKQTHGVHSIETYMTAELDGEQLESNRLISDVMCVEEGNNTVLIASVYEANEVGQGEQVSIPYIVYDPSALNAEVDLIVSCGEIEYSRKTITVDRTKQYWNERDYPVGEVAFTIKCGEVEKTHVVNVGEADIDVTPVTNDLELYLTSSGRSNNEADPGVWEHGDVATTFTNVNWDSTGWIADENGDTVLRLNGGATAEIAFKPFETDFKNYGKTIEIEFAIRDVNNREAVVLSCMNDGIGIEVTADKATLRSEQSEITCHFCDEERIRVSFVVESRSEYRLLQIYLNGVLSGAKQYPATDNFQQTTPMNIVLGSPYCGIDVYTIRSYSNALTFTEVIENYISDIPDMAEKASVYEANDIYDEYGNMLYEEVKKKDPVMTFIGSLPKSKGDKKDLIVKFEHNTIKELNYQDEVELDVQGTSSQWFVRKNFKGKTKNAHKHAVGQMPSRVFCVKADYAEATGTHNTQNANLVETLYSEKTPAQIKDARCRTTIFGYPIVIFHQETEDSTPVFIGKYNYNFDKGSEEVFGFDGSFDVESWEFKNNTSDVCNFLAPITGDWGEDFEARYPDGHKDLSRFKVMHDWVVSTKGNVEKFKAEFENYFDLHFSLIYYVYTSVMLMVDQRAKNMFLTYWAATGKWQPWFYDNDTCLGINNEGQMVFDYYHEDIDKVGGANVYNGQNSTLWVNFREAFADEIKAMYQKLRSDKKLTYDKVIEYFVTNGSDKWSASIYNEDADYKYISMLRSDNDATNLYQVRGTGEEHLKYFISNRLKYMDSKWYASDYADNYVALRIYTPEEWRGVEPNADITITPFSNMYAGVRYKANGTLVQERVEANEEITFEAPNETFNDTETAIYGASEISSLGDLAPLYCGSINVSKASRLINLKVGDATEGYQNNNLTELSVGTNRLLKVVDVRNCPKLTDPLALTGCPNIEEIYATGSGITGVELPKSGYLKKIHLPATITNLTLQNQIYIEDLRIDGYENISTLNIENCPTLNELDILNECINIKRVRLANVDWKFDNASSVLTFVNALIEKGVKGVDENGLNVDTPQISGKCHIKTLTGAEFATIKAAFPYMTITYNSLTAQLVFKLQNGTELARQTITNGGNGYDPITKGEIAAPTLPSTAQYHYTFKGGWSLTPDGEANENALKKVEADRIVYPVFVAELRTYNVYFYNLDTLMYTAENVPYGGSAVYLGDYPENNTTGNTADFLFTGWSPLPDNIVGETRCYAQYEDRRAIEDSWATILANANNGTATSTYGLGRPKVLDIGEESVTMQVAGHNTDDLPDGVTKWKALGTLPYSFKQGSAVVYNGEIHILGGTGGNTKHYKWNGSEWINVSTLPYMLGEGSAVVYNGEIHIIGSALGSSDKHHYKWNGNEWVNVSTLPYMFYRCPAVVYNDEIHIMGRGADNKNHYKWNGSEWVSASTLPYAFHNGSTVVYDGELHILGGNTSPDYIRHYKWNGTEWVSVSTLPYGFKYGSVFVYRGEIHIIGGENGNTKHYKWNGIEWESADTLPYTFTQGSAVVYHDEIHIMGGINSGCDKLFYSFDTSPTATLTFVGKFVLKDKRPLTSMREYLNGDFISLLPADLQTALTTVKKVTNGEVTNDKVWQLSVEEVEDGNEIYPAIFKDASSRVKTTMDGTPSTWGLRTGEIVDENGAIITADDPNEEQGVLIGFCIG